MTFITIYLNVFDTKLYFILIHFQTLQLIFVYLTLQLIFVYLKMPKEHRNLTFPLRTEGKIHYTRPLDMMKAEDRAEVCEFLYWLGCVQNRYGSKLFG